MLLPGSHCEDRTLDECSVSAAAAPDTGSGYTSPYSNSAILSSCGRIRASLLGACNAVMEPEQSCRQGMRRDAVPAKAGRDRSSTELPTSPLPHTKSTLLPALSSMTAGNSSAKRYLPHGSVTAVPVPPGSSQTRSEFLACGLPRVTTAAMPPGTCCARAPHSHTRFVMGLPFSMSYSQGAPTCCLTPVRDAFAQLMAFSSKTVPLPANAALPPYTRSGCAS